MKLLLDEMYPPALAEQLAEAGIEAITAVERGLGGKSDAELFSFAVTDGYAILTENVADFPRIAGDHLTTGGHHYGVLIALSSRFSRRPADIRSLGRAIQGITDEGLADRLIYLERPSDE